MRIVNRSLALSVSCHMEDCRLAGCTGLLRAFLDFARFGREVDGSRAGVGDGGVLAVALMGDLTDLTDFVDLSEFDP